MAVAVLGATLGRLASCKELEFCRRMTSPVGSLITVAGAALPTCP